MGTGENQKIEIIAYHGWGFGSDFWNDWKKAVSPDVTFKTADRGYFYDQKTPRFSEGDSLKILMTHSFGIHLSAHQNILDANIVVVFNGFQNFHPQEETYREKSLNVLSRMISKFKEQPKSVLSRFWENTFYPETDIGYENKHDFDKSLLLQDLIKLDSAEFEFQKLKDLKPIISIDGGNDKILGEPRGKVFTHLSERDAVYHFIKEAGHALPLTHLQDCWSFINAMIPIFSNHEQYRRTKEETQGY